MTFVDTNVIMYAVGGEHPHRSDARSFFADALAERRALVTSSEVLQELLHVYLPVGRFETLDAALTLVRGVIGTVWAVEEEDVLLARSLAHREPALGARDLVHLACCTRRGVTAAKTFDRALAAAMT